MVKTFFIAAALLLPAAAFAAPAETEPRMAVAEVVDAPLGYIEMCRRHADECGGKVPELPSAVATTNTSQEFWTAVFGRRPAALDSASSEAARLTPASVQVASIGQSWTLAYRTIAIVQDAAADGSVDTLEQADAEPRTSPAISTAVFADLKALRRVNTKVNRAIRRANDFDVFGRADFWAVPEDGAKRGDCEDYVLAKRRALLDGGVPAGALSIALVRTRRGETHAVLLVATPKGEVVLDNLSPWVLPWQEAPYTWIQRQVADTGDWVRVAG